MYILAIRLQLWRNALLTNIIKAQTGKLTDRRVCVIAISVVSLLIVYALTMHLFAGAKAEPPRSGSLDAKECLAGSGCGYARPVVTLPPRASRTGVCQLAPISSHC